MAGEEPPITCLADIDCPSTLICYNTSWTNYESVCLCSTWFGFSGPNCENALETATSVWRVATTAIFVTLWFLVFVVGVNDFRKLIVFSVGGGWTVTHTCQVQLIIASLLSTIAEAMGIVTTLTPMEMVHYLPGTDRKASTLFYPKQIITTLSYCFIFLTLATMPLHWREIANQAFRANKRKLSYLRPLIIFELLFSALTLIFVAFSMPTAAYITAIPFVIVVVALYGICGLSLWRILIRAAVAQGPEQRQRFLKSARTVANTSLKMFGMGLGVIITNAVFGAISGEPQWREASPPGVIAAPLIFGALSNVFLLSAAIFGQFYLSSTIHSTLTRSSSYQANVSNPLKASRGNRSHPLKNQNSNNEDDHHGADYSSAQPDSIVAMDDPKAIKSKRKILKRKGGPRRLRPITDMTFEATNHTASINPAAESVVVSSMEEGIGEGGSSSLQNNKSNTTGSSVFLMSSDSQQ